MSDFFWFVFCIYGHVFSVFSRASEVCVVRQQQVQAASLQARKDAIVLAVGVPLSLEKIKRVSSLIFCLQFRFSSLSFLQRQQALGNSTVSLSFYETKIMVLKDRIASLTSTKVISLLSFLPSTILTFFLRPWRRSGLCVIDFSWSRDVWSYSWNVVID